MLLGGKRSKPTPRDYLVDLSSVHEQQRNHEHISIFMPLTFTENAHILSVREKVTIWQQHFTSQIISLLLQLFDLRQ